MSNIIHYKYIIIKKYMIEGYCSKEIEYYYLCNQAIKSNEKKMTRNWNKVTCKNCLKGNATSSQGRRK